MALPRVICLEVYVSEFNHGNISFWQVGVYEEHSCEGLADLQHCFLHGDGEFDDDAAVQVLIRAFELVLCSVKVFEVEVPTPRYVVYSSMRRLLQLVELLDASAPCVSNAHSFALQQRYEELTAQLHRFGIEGSISYADAMQVFQAKSIVEMAATEAGQFLLSDEATNEALSEHFIPQPRGSARLATEHSVPPVVTNRWMLEDYETIQPFAIPDDCYPDPLLMMEESGERIRPQRESITAIGIGTLCLSVEQREGSKRCLCFGRDVLHCPNAPYCYTPVGQTLIHQGSYVSSLADDGTCETLFRRRYSSWLLQLEPPQAEPYLLIGTRERHRHDLLTAGLDTVRPPSPGPEYGGTLPYDLHAEEEAKGELEESMETPENLIWDPNYVLYECLI